jgi:hypothetical protein
MRSFVNCTVKSRRMRWAEHVVRMAEKRNVYDFGGKGKRKETTRKISTRWVDNIKMDFKEVE